MRGLIALVLMGMLCFGFALEAAAALQQAYGADYKKYCGEYGIETAALRTCMDKNGHSLTQTCVRALIDAGEVSQAEVDRVKSLGTSSTYLG